MIFSFATQGRDRVAAMTGGLTVAPIDGAERGEPYRSGIVLVSAAITPEARALPVRLLKTCRGLLQSRAPGFFQSFQSLALKLFHQPRDLFVKSHKGFVKVHRNLLSLINSTSGDFQWKQGDFGKAFQKVTA